MRQVLYLKVVDKSGRTVHREGAIGIAIDDRGVDLSVSEVEDGVYDI